MHCVDLGESFQTHIYLQNFVSIQPRTNPVKFAEGRRKSAGKAQPRGGAVRCLVQVAAQAGVVRRRDGRVVDGGRRGARDLRRDERHLLHEMLPNLQMFATFWRASKFHLLQNMPKIGELVLGCIEADLCE